MEDSWSLISVVQECVRKTQSNGPKVEGGPNISAETARPTTVDKVRTNYSPNQFCDQFCAGSSSGQPLQNTYFCNQFNAGTNSTTMFTTKTTRLDTGVGNTDEYFPNPFSNQFGAGNNSSSGELLQHLENILFSDDDQFNANANTTVGEINDDYLSNPFSDQFGASNNSSSGQNSQNLQNTLFYQFDASAPNISFQDLLFKVELSASTNNSNSASGMQTPLISDQSDANTSNAFRSSVLLPVASTAEGNVCGHNLRDLCQPASLLLQPAPAPDAPVISKPALVAPVERLLQEFKQVPDTPDHMFSQCQGYCSCPDGFHCGFGKKRSVYIMDIEQLKGLDDKWAWRKYGQKPIKASPYPRNYYKCSSKKNCMAKKQVERSYEDPEKYIVTYIGQHYHPYPAPRTNNGGPRPKSHPDPPPETESPPTRMVTQSGGPSGFDCMLESGSGSGSGSRSGSGENVMGAAGGCGDHDEEQEENNYKIVIPEAAVDMDSLLDGNMDGMVVEESRKIDKDDACDDDFFDVILNESGYGYGYGYGYEKNTSVCDPNVYDNGVQERGRIENRSENKGGGNPETTHASATLMVGNFQ